MASQEISGLTSRHGRLSSADERQSSFPATSVRHGAASPTQSRNEGTTATASTASSSHQSLAEQNKGLKGVKEDPSTLATWDAWHHHWLKMWSAFGNWNNRQVLKDINASPAVLRTYHDSFLFGEVPWAVKARATLRTGFIGSIWNLWEPLMIPHPHIIQEMYISFTEVTRHICESHFSSPPSFLSYDILRS